MLFYTYLWRDPDGNPFYVGKGKGGRAHSLSRRSNEFMEIYEQGGCSVEIVDEFILEPQAHAHEMELIARYGRREFGGPLVNKTDGGEGSSGAVPSEEARKRNSESQLRRYQDPKERERQSEGLRRRYSDLKEREKTSAANLMAYAKDPERGPSHSLALVEHYKNSAAREKISEGNRRRYRDPAEREKSAIAIRMYPPRKSNTSGFKGVTKAVDSGNWIAKIKIADNHVVLGTYPTKELAAMAYDRAAIAAWPAGCYLNFHDRAGETDPIPSIPSRGPKAGIRKNNSSGFKGVSYSKPKGKWAAAISVEKRLRHIGYFSCAEDAALAYDAVAHALWGMDCHLNFPDRVGEVEPVTFDDSPWRGPRRGSKHGYKGISFFKRTGRWIAQISVAGKNRGLGYYDSAEEAAVAYDEAAYAAWGNDCYLNFPERFAAAA